MKCRTGALSRLRSTAGAEDAANVGHRKSEIARTRNERKRMTMLCCCCKIAKMSPVVKECGDCGIGS